MRAVVTRVRSASVEIGGGGLVVAHVARREAAHLGVQGVERRGDVHDEAGALLGEDAERGDIEVRRVVGPADLYPAPVRARREALAQVVLAVRRPPARACSTWRT